MPTPRLCLAALLLLLPAAALAQTPLQTVQKVVDTERAANAADHSEWLYFQDNRKPHEHIVQWVAATPHGSVCRVLERDGRTLSEAEQQAEIQRFLHDTRAQNKEIAENKHDLQQVDDLLKLLPQAFLWTRTAATETSTTLHFEPDPKFHPPTRDARVFAGMTGDLVADNASYRIRSMNGHLIHDVTFGGGLLGRLKQGSSFALEQQPVGDNLWQLTAIRVHLDGNALLFHSVSLQQDDERSRFTREPDAPTLEQAAAAVLRQAATVPRQQVAAR